MLLSTVLSLETSDVVCIYLHHEGIFWKAYERSAYLFLQKTKMDYKVKCRKVKSLGTTVCSIGFPDTVLHQLFSDAELTALPGDMEAGKESKTLCVDAAGIDISGLSAWLEQVKKETESSKTETMAAAEIWKRIVDFDMANATPMDCLMFVSELKHRCSVLVS